MSQEIQDSENIEMEAVAIIGMAGRFPKAADLDQFWRNLAAGAECISFFSPAELESAGVGAMVLESPEFVPARAILEGAENFDAQFFGINPREAEQTDPQHRLFLESCWEALENANVDPSRFEGLVGVFAGADVNSYAVTNLLLGSEGLQTLIGNDKDYLATRVAYKLNLHGPAISVQTACSTSLVATHLACQSLLSYQSDLALAGGVGVNFPQKGGYFYQEGGILSPDGHCRPFDAAAKGTVGGDGVGVVVLKRLSEALRDRDGILAIIRGSAVNNDGSLKVGFTAPSVEGQAEVVALAQAAAGVEPDQIGYIETHGTGTQLGDPIEIAALQDVFRASSERRGFCAIGSLKSNVGHMNSAAGVGSLIKTVLALQHKQIPPSLHFKTPNPMIDFEQSPFYVAAQLQDWESNGQPRRAGVSSFGIGGTNAHLVLEEAPSQDSDPANRSFQLLPLSAKSQSALQAMQQRLADWLQGHPDAQLADVAFSLQTGRQWFSHRSLIVAETREQAISHLEIIRGPGAVFYAHEPKKRSAVFLFPGQGSQYANMTRDLFQTEPVYRQALERCASLIQAELALNLLDLLFPQPGGEEEANRLLAQTGYTQPALFAVEYALAQWWISIGVRPSALFGHSIGEYVAACLAEVFSLEDAVKLVVGRGKDLQAQPPGAMLAVQLAEDEARRLSGLSLSAVNGPFSCVVGGEPESVEVAEHMLNQRGIPHSRLHTSHAFHTGLIAGMAKPFLPRFNGIKLNPPQIPFISNLTGTWIKDSEATDPHYWVKQALNPVRFSAGIATLIAQGEPVFIEVGPGNSLLQLASKQAAEIPSLASVRHPRESRHDSEFLMTAVGQAYAADLSIDWLALHGGRDRLRLQLPSYPFERERFWSDPGERLRKLFEAKPFYGKLEDPARWLHTPGWRRLGADRPSDAASSVQLPILVFALDDGPSAQLLRHLRLRFERVIAVQPGSAFRKLSPLDYQIDPHDFSAYERLVTDLTGSGLAPGRIAHLWQWDFSTHPAQDEESFELAQARGFYSLLFLVKALGKAHLPHALVLDAVAGGLHEITGSERIFPERATTLGVALAISQEYSRIIARVLDLDSPGDQAGPRADAFFERVIQQMLQPVDHGLVAFRGPYRWVPDYQPVQFAPPPQPEAEIPTTAPFKRGGAYLITGGLGGIGLIFARHLATHYGARLVLTGRTGVPARSEWKAWLNSHDPQNRVSVRIRKLIELEEAGAEVLTLSADIGSPQQMAEVWRESRARFGRMDGVIHAAGHVGQGLLSPIAEVSWDQCQLHFHSKVHGLYTLVKGMPDDLDFCLLTSSLAAVLGGVGGAAYSAANAFMDAYALTRDGQSTRFLSLNWDAWMPHEGSPEADGPTPAWARFAIHPHEGLKVLEFALTTPNSSRFVVSTTDLQMRLDQLLRTERSEDGDKAREAEVAARHSRPAQNTEYVAPRTELEALLAEIWQALLGIDKVGVLDNFFKLGGDSLVAIQLGTRLRDALGIEFSVNQLFDEPTIAGLAERIEALRAQKGESTPHEEALLAHLELVENMSDEEVAKMLADLENQGGEV